MMMIGMSMMMIGVSMMNDPVLPKGHPGLGGHVITLLLVLPHARCPPLSLGEDHPPTRAAGWIPLARRGFGVDCAMNPTKGQE